MSNIEVHKLPADVLEKVQIVGNIFDDLEKYKKKLDAINEIVNGDWGYSVTDEMVDLHNGGYKEFTQKQAQEMADAIGKIYSIAHTVHCAACDRTWEQHLGTQEER